MGFDASKVSANRIVDERGQQARDDLGTQVRVEDADAFPHEDGIYSDKRVWIKISDVVALAVDLKNSTEISFRHYPQTAARLYEAMTGNSARIVEKFAPQFVDIQGDGLFALFHGEKARERALCAGISLRTFGERHLVPGINSMEKSKMREHAQKVTGLKIGLASGTLAVKKVGVRGKTEPVWAGRPVNFATKCADQAGANEIVATETVFNAFRDNDYVTHSCGCPSGTPSELWSEARVEKLPEEHAQGMVLGTGWCVEHGDDFCRAILEGETTRDDVASIKWWTDA